MQSRQWSISLSRVWLRWCDEIMKHLERFLPLFLSLPLLQQYELYQIGRRILSCNELVGVACLVLMPIGGDWLFCLHPHVYRLIILLLRFCRTFSCLVIFNLHLSVLVAEFRSTSIAPGFGLCGSSFSLCLRRSRTSGGQLWSSSLCLHLAFGWRYFGLWILPDRLWFCQLRNCLSSLVLSWLFNKHDIHATGRLCLVAWMDIVNARRCRRWCSWFQSGISGRLKCTHDRLS